MSSLPDHPQGKAPGHRSKPTALLPIVAAAILTVPAIAAAQAWPSKPLTLVVPFPAGGGTDLVVRSIQPLLQRELGQPVVIDNRSGAGGTIGSTYVARAVPDGYIRLVWSRQVLMRSVPPSIRTCHISPRATSLTPDSSAHRPMCWR
nr:tripartite tricarboxylate transporter substrate-binding protein [uncultured Cupriavidus sp.]